MFTNTVAKVRAVSLSPFWGGGFDSGREGGGEGGDSVGLLLLFWEEFALGRIVLFFVCVFCMQLASY